MSLRHQKIIVGIICLGPLVWLAASLASGLMGANPIEATNRFLGDWALRFLLVALAVTPARRVFHLNSLARFRRMLGLFAFFYVFLHVTNYLAVDQFFDWSEIWIDVTKRLFMTAGMGAFLIIAALAATSTDSMQKRMGGRRWRQLHRLVYLAAILAVTHFYMMVKADVTEPVIYGTILAALFIARVKEFYSWLDSRLAASSSDSGR